MSASVQPGHRFGPYILDRELGRGGFGIVYRARHTGTGSAYAVKLVRTDLAFDPSDLVRFRREAELLARLRHPGIVTVHAIGEQDGILYTAMELVAGRSLAARLDADGSLPPDEAVRIAVAAADVLAFVHTEGIVHRDVKPANVLLGDDGRLRLLDLGLGFDATLTRISQSGESVGTPSFMAPEQVMNPDAVGPAADVYGLGATLYALLAGRPPFVAADVREVLLLRIEHAPEPPSTHRPGLPAELDAICLRALATRAVDRYASAEALADDLRRWLRGERPVALPAAPGRPGPAAIAAVVIALLAVAAVAALALGGSWMAEDLRDPHAVAFDAAFAALAAGDATALERASAARASLAAKPALLAVRDEELALLDRLAGLVEEEGGTPGQLHAFLTHDRVGEHGPILLARLFADHPDASRLARLVSARPTLVDDPDGAAVLSDVLDARPRWENEDARGLLDAVVEALDAAGVAADRETSARRASIRAMIARRRLETTILGPIGSGDDSGADALEADLDRVLPWVGRGYTASLSDEALATTRGYLDETTVGGRTREALMLVAAVFLPPDDAIGEEARSGLERRIRERSTGQTPDERADGAFQLTLRFQRSGVRELDGRNLEYLLRSGLPRWRAQARRGDDEVLAACILEALVFVARCDENRSFIVDPLVRAPRIRAVLHEHVDLVSSILERERRMGDAPPWVLAWLADVLGEARLWDPATLAAEARAAELAAEVIASFRPATDASAEAAMGELIDELIARARARSVDRPLRQRLTRVPWAWLRRSVKHGGQADDEEAVEVLVAALTEAPPIELSASTFHHGEKQTTNELIELSVYIVARDLADDADEGGDCEHGAIVERVIRLIRDRKTKPTSEPDVLAAIHHIRHDRAGKARGALHRARRISRGSTAHFLLATATAWLERGAIDAARRALELIVVEGLDEAMAGRRIELRAAIEAAERGR